MKAREQLLGNPSAEDEQLLSPILDDIARRMLVLTALFTPFFLVARMAPVLVPDPPMTALLQLINASIGILVIIAATLNRQRLNSRQIGWIMAVLAALVGLVGIYRSGTSTALVSFIFISLMSLALFVGRRVALTAGISMWTFAMFMTLYRNHEQLTDFGKLVDMNSGIIGLGPGFGSGILVIIMMSEVLPRLLVSIEDALRQRSEEATRRWYAEARSEAVEYRWQAYLDGAPMGIALMDEAGKIISWNRYNERYLGYSAEQVLGKTMEDHLLALDAAHPLIVRLAQVFQGKPLQDFVMQLATEEGPRTVLLQAAPIYDEHEAIQGAFLGGVDITHLLASDQSDPSTGPLLGQQSPLAMLSNKLLEIRSALMTAGLSAETIVTALAHSNAPTAELADKALLWVAQQQKAASLADAAFSLVADRTERTTAQDAGRVAEAAVNILRGRVKAAGVEVDFDDAFAEGALVSADAVLLRQILINLISNAREAVCRSAKATERRIRVTVVAESQSVEFVVEDSAGSMMPVNREVFFSPGYSTKDQGGDSGKGLYVSRHTAERMGGSLNVEQGEAGLRFVLTLPRYLENYAV